MGPQQYMEIFLQVSFDDVTRVFITVRPMAVGGKHASHGTLSQTYDTMAFFLEELCNMVADLIHRERDFGNKAYIHIP